MTDKVYVSHSMMLESWVSPKRSLYIAWRLEVSIHVHIPRRKGYPGVPGITTRNTVTGAFFRHSSAINTGSVEGCYVYIAIPEAKTGARYQSKLVDTTGARVSLATGIPFHVMLYYSLGQRHQGMLKGQLCFLFVMIAILLSRHQCPRLARTPLNPKSYSCPFLH